MTSRDADLGWAAGFFDGEGHVSYRRGTIYLNTGRVSGTIYLCVPQNADNVEVLEKFQRIIGFGKISGPYKVRTNGKTNLRMEYRVGVKNMRRLFVLLKDNLATKKTRDFERAFMQYEFHDTEATIEDILKAVARSEKKRRKLDK